MAPNSYGHYNYPYQQSSAQQYSAYQTAPAPNNGAQPQPPHQYQEPPTSQASDYMSYQGTTYGVQGNAYTAGQDSSWGGNSYGATRETTSRAAEVLRNMSNTSYTPNSTTASQPGFTATNADASQAARYSNSPRMQAQQTHPTPTSYAQAQARPRSVNAARTPQPPPRGLPSPAQSAGYPAQRAQTMYSQQQQRSTSPAQNQYNNPAATSAGPSRTSVTQQYTDYDRRQLASVEASRTNQGATSSIPYNYPSSQTVAPPGPIAPPASVQESYPSQSSITVDPMAVYDPWPEYQRKEEARRAQKAIEDAARAEEDRVAEEARKVEEAQKEEERLRLEELERAAPAST
jgi:hypothetical protein